MDYHAQLIKECQTATKASEQAYLAAMQVPTPPHKFPARALASPEAVDARRGHVCMPRGWRQAALP